MGNGNKYNNMKEVAYDMLEYYYSEGLNILKDNTNNTYSIIKEKLDLEAYDKAINELDELDINDFPPNDPYYSGILK